MPQDAAATPLLSIVIPTWNGRELLARHLPSVMAELQRWERGSGAEGELVISDDGSNDGTAAWLRAAWPRARLDRSERNRGFAPAANAGVAAARGRLILLLNNDLELMPGALERIAGAFAAAPELFGVTLRAENESTGELETGGKCGRYRRGFWECWRNFEVPTEGAREESFALVGGFCAFRRALFLELGGFDAAFAPYYWEDVDLSYRARKRGWRLAYEPDARVRHQISATTTRHASAYQRAAITHRNRLWFHWKNLDGGRLPAHIAWVAALAPQMALRGEFSYHDGLLRALAGLPGLLRRRRQERAWWRRRDAELEIPTAGNSRSSLPPLQ